MRMQEKASIPRHSNRFKRVYIALWANLAVLALGYMTLLGVAPDWKVRIEVHGTQAAAPDEAGTAQNEEQVDVFRKTVADQEGEVALSDISTAAFGDQETAVPSRVDTEQPIGTLASPPAEQQTNPEPPATAVAPVSAIAIEEPSPVVFDAPAASGPKVIIVDGATVSAIATSGLAAPQAPIAFGPATVKPAPDPVAIQLGSGSSVEALQLNWGLLRDQHYSILRNLEPRYHAVGTGDALTYQLIAGPIASAPEAKRVCALLRTKKVACGVGPFGGEAL